MDKGISEDAPLSDHDDGSNGGHKIMSRDDRNDRDEEVMGSNPRPAATNTTTGPDTALPVSLEAMDPTETPLLGNPVDTDDKKARQDAFQLLMQGFYSATHTLSNSYQDACWEVQTIVWRALQRATAVDHTFVWGASSAICHWVKEVQPAMDCMEGSLEEQARLLQRAREAGKEPTKDILALLPTESDPYLTPVVPREDIFTPALKATRVHTEKAIEAINAELSMLVHHHFPPQQARVFLATLFQVMCSYWQEMDGMAASQVVLPAQIIPNLWGISQSVMEGLTLLGPPGCPASWPSSLVEQIAVEPVKKTAPPWFTTLVKRDSSVPGKGKSQSGSSGKKSIPPKWITEYWDDEEWKKEDEESRCWEEEKKKKPAGPVLSLDKHEESVIALTSKTTPSWVSQAPGLSGRAPSDSKRSRSKVRRASPVRLNSSADEPLLDKAGELEPKSRKKDHTAPDLLIVDDDDDDPLPGKPKGTGKKGKPHVYTQDELAGLKVLNLWLKSKARSIQYGLETAGLTRYQNSHIPGLRGAPNTDDHSAYLAEVKKESWSYPTKGNLSTVQQFVKELERCPDPEKRKATNNTLQNKGMPGIPQENTIEAGKRKMIKARYVMKVLQSVEGETIDAKHPDYGQDQNIGLYDIMSLASMRKVEWSSQTTVWAKNIRGNVDYGYCPLCLYASQNHQTLNNHIWMHFHVTMACGMPDCWYVSHNADSMWKHATQHGLQIAEPAAPPFGKRK